MKSDVKNWPVLIVSGQLDAANDDGFRLRELISSIEQKQNCTALTSSSYEDALEIIQSRADIGCLIIDWDLPREDEKEKMPPECLLEKVRSRNSDLPIILLTDRTETENLPRTVLENINDCMWKTADTADFLAGRVEIWINSYIEKVTPGFFRKLTEYSEMYKYAWHTPGHLGGIGFLRAPAGVAMYKFFGENTFRSDLSISVPELGSLLDHEGACGDAEKRSAKVFHADQTYYVLNGTSSVNQIIWRSQVTENDIAFVDRNCHKSLNHAMVITGAYPVYMMPRRNHLGIIGPVRKCEFSGDFIKKQISSSKLIPEGFKKNKVKMSALTNSTYDGICYNVSAIKTELGHHTENIHFDEAWYAYAAFHPIYRSHYGMTQEKLLPETPPIFCSQSTHKLLTAFSQASMLHIRNGGSVKIDPVRFNEAYMMHGSTSPQYSMIASLDVATAMMAQSGPSLIGDIIREAVMLRKRIASLKHECFSSGEWFFSIWQPDQVRAGRHKKDFFKCEDSFLAENQEPWVLNKEDRWHGFDDIEECFAMLDPIKLTIVTPGMGADGSLSDSGGIPAAVVSNFLLKRNIVCEKCDYYSFLLLNSLGTTRAKQGALLTALFEFKKLYDSNAPLADVFPELAAAYPSRYSGETLKYHCDSMHAYLKEHRIMQLMHNAFETLPDQRCRPADAFHQLVQGKCEHVYINGMMDRTAAVMLVPYPPGIPILMGGEIINSRSRAVFQYLLAREDFENHFPGYESDIHGIERIRVDNRTVFRTLALCE